MARPLGLLVLLIASCQPGTSASRAPAQLVRPPEALPDTAVNLHAAEGFSDRPALLVGCWSELASETPSWVFPTVRVRWKGETDPNTPSLERVRRYADAHIRLIRRAPAGRPVWIVGYGWLGRSEYRDSASPLANRRDATPEGTPGIWPDYGLNLWRQRQETFLAHLKEAGVELDFWCADNELHINEWSANFQAPWTFRNIVLDRRWETKPLLGLGITGASLLNPDRVRGDGDQWIKGKFDTPDSRLAHDHVRVAALFVRHEVLRRLLVEPVLEAYPDALVSNYGSYARPLGVAGVGDDDGDGSIPPPSGDAAVWWKLRAIAPAVRELGGVGNVASPVFYGGIRYRRVPEDEVVERMFDLTDALIERYGGPDRVAPWIAYPTFGDAGGRHLSPAQYRRLVVGLAQRGIRRLLLWNGGEAAARPEVEAELLAVLREASAVAAGRMANEAAR